VAGDLDRFCRFAGRSDGYFRRRGPLDDPFGGWGFRPALPSMRSLASPIRLRHFSNQSAGLLPAFVFNSYPAARATAWQ
jgi:hypothetical protein